MSFSYRLFVLTFLSSLLTVTGFGLADEAEKPDQKPDPRVGTRVIVTEAAAPLRTPEKIVWKAYLGETFTVSLTNGEWLWVAEKGGWLWEKQTVPFATAVADLSARVDAEPTAENLHLRGVAYSAHGNYDSAIADFSASLQKNADNAGVLNNRGQAFYLKNDFDKAIQDFNSAITADPKHFVALNNRALCYIAVGNLDGASKDLDAAIAANKEYPEALNNRGVVHARQGDYQSAIDDYTAALKIDDRYADAYGNRSFAYRQLNQFDMAVADLHVAMEKSPLDFKPVNDLAWVLATVADESIRDPQKAIALAKQACGMTQYENWNTMDTLAAAYAAAGDFKLAQQWIATAVEKAPAKDKTALEEHVALFQEEKTIMK